MSQSSSQDASQDNEWGKDAADVLSALSKSAPAQIGDNNINADPPRSEISNADQEKRVNTSTVPADSILKEKKPNNVNDPYLSQDILGNTQDATKLMDEIVSMANKKIAEAVE